MTAPWAALPPDEAYNLLALGEGETSTVAAGAAWQAQTLEGLVNAGVSQANTAMTMPAWMGLGGTVSTESATVMNGLLDALSGWAQAKVPIAESAAAAYRSALSMMIPTPECLSNRVEQAHDVGINPLVWGALTPDIVRLDTQYFGFYWPNNAAQGTAYSALLLGFLSTLAIPPPVGAPMGSPAAPAEAAAQIAQTTAESSAGDAMRESMQSGLGVTDQLAGSQSSAVDDGAADERRAGAGAGGTGSFEPAGRCDERADSGAAATDGPSSPACSVRVAARWLRRLCCRLVVRRRCRSPGERRSRRWVAGCSAMVTAKRTKKQKLPV